MFNHISVDTLNRIAELSRMARGTEQPSMERRELSESAAAPSDLRQLKENIAALTPEERLELIAAMLVGRGEFAAGEWLGAITRARAIAGSDVVERIAAKPKLEEHLRKALHELRLLDATELTEKPARARSRSQKG